MPAARKAEAADSFRALQGPILGLLATSVGTNFSSRSQGYELGCLMHFEDRAALDAYYGHALHQALAQWLRALDRGG